MTGRIAVDMFNDRGNLISRKKPFFPIEEPLEAYLRRYRRIRRGGIQYADLTRHDNAIPLYDEHGEDTLWSSVFYPATEQLEINELLLTTYAILKMDGDLTAVEGLFVDRVDLCLYGNTLPYRVRIVNEYNENFDYFYVKQVDANRIYGLELEHILSPSRIGYFVSGKTIIEEHIIGIPSKDFMHNDMPQTHFDQVRLAKEFVKFNERCFVRLLGDMHAGNFVIDIRRDFEKMHFLMSPIDFDQQSHHWRREVYLPYQYPNNEAFVEMTLEHLSTENRLQYRKEERALIGNRIRVSHGRFDALMSVMADDYISDTDNVRRLAQQLSDHYETEKFDDCLTMGDLVNVSTHLLLLKGEPALSLTWMRD